MRLSLVVSALLLAIACKQPVQKQPASNEPVYPYPQYIESQISYVDSAQLGIEITVQENGITTDSGFIKREEFHKMAAQFMSPDPNKSDIRKEYTESSFQDLTLRSITFRITTANPDMPLQEADILLNPETKQVKYLVLKKQINTDSGTAYSSLMWRHNMNFQILTTVTNKDGKENSRLIRVVWDKPVSELMK